MVREEIEFGGLVPEQVDVTSIDVVIEPLLGDAKLLSDFSDGEVACGTTRVSMGTFQQELLLETNAPDRTREDAVTAG